jgi:hypothetical protein
LNCLSNVDRIAIIPHQHFDCFSIGSRGSSQLKLFSVILHSFKEFNNNLKDFYKPNSISWWHYASRVGSDCHLIGIIFHFFWRFTDSLTCETSCAIFNQRQFSMTNGRFSFQFAM